LIGTAKMVLFPLKKVDSVTGVLSKKFVQHGLGS